MSPELARLAASATVVAHLLFIVFVGVGGFALLRWPKLAWLHLPAVAWSVPMQALGWICPLTHLENHFLRLAGGRGYAGGFVERYVVAVVYPEWRAGSAWMGVLLAAVVFVLNVTAYGLAWRRRGRAAGPARS